MADEKTREAGHELGSVAKGIFFGEVDENLVFPFPEFDGDQKEIAKTVLDAIQKFGEEKIDSAKMDETCQIPQEVFDGLAELGLYGLAVPEQYGGMELPYSLYARVFSDIAEIDGSVATMLGAHQSIGYKALLNEGNEEQKAKYLPRLASGEMLASFCLTEPGSGSDAYSIKTKAVDNKDGTYTLNGQKLWITNAGTAKFYTVFCKTDHEVDGEIKEKISAFIVDGDSEGISFGEKENKLGIRASETRAVYFDNVKVPAAHLLGGPGKGFKIAMNVLNTGRLSLGSGSVGAMRSVLKLASKQAMERKQFGASIAEFGMIQHKLAHMAASIYASESIVYLTTGLMDKGMHDFSIEAAICKVYCSEAMWQTVDSGLQVAAGIGYMKEYPYERIMRDARINLIFEGTNEILRCLIALAGIKSPSEELRELGKITEVSSVLNDPIKSLGVLSDFAKKRLSRMISSKVLTKVHHELEDQSQQFSNMLGEFAISVENLLISYGAKIVGNELPQKRLAEMAMDLYVQLAVLSRTTSILQNDQIAKEKKEYVKGLSELIFRDTRHRFVGNLKEMKNNNDKLIKSVSKSVCEFEGYGLDIVDF